MNSGDNDLLFAHLSRLKGHRKSAQSAPLCDA